MQASCVDLVSRINGDLGGQLVGGTHRIEKGTRIGDAIWAVLRDETEFKKYSIDYWSRTVPHDLDYDTGSTVWDILSELRDLYYPFEMCLYAKKFPVDLMTRLCLTQKYSRSL